MPDLRPLTDEECAELARLADVLSVPDRTYGETGNYGYFVLHDDVRDLIRLAGSPAIADYQYLNRSADTRDWYEAAAKGGVAALRGLSFADCRTFLTALARAERFSEGTMHEALKKGVVQALLAQMLAVMPRG